MATTVKTTELSGRRRSSTTPPEASPPEPNLSVGVPDLWGKSCSFNNPHCCLQPGEASRRADVKKHLKGTL